MRLVIVGKSGSLHQFVREVKNKKGIVSKYPKVAGRRNPNNPEHYEWQWTYKYKVENTQKSRCIRVHPTKALETKRLILEHATVSQIEAFLKG